MPKEQMHPMDFILAGQKDDREARLLAENVRLGNAVLDYEQANTSLTATNKSLQTKAKNLRERHDALVKNMESKTVAKGSMPYGLLMDQYLQLKQEYAALEVSLLPTYAANAQAEASIVEYRRARAEATRQDVVGGQVKEPDPEVPIKDLDACIKRMVTEALKPELGDLNVKAVKSRLRITMLSILASLLSIWIVVLVCKLYL